MVTISRAESVGGVYNTNYNTRTLRVKEPRESCRETQ